MKCKQFVYDPYQEDACWFCLKSEKEHANIVFNIPIESYDSFRKRLNEVYIQNYGIDSIKL